MLETQKRPAGVWGTRRAFRTHTHTTTKRGQYGTENQIMKSLIVAAALLMLSGPASAGTLKHDMRTFMERAHKVYLFNEERVVGDPLADKTYEQLAHAADEAYAKLIRHKPYCAYKNGSMGLAIGRCIGKRIYWLKPGSLAAKYAEEFSKEGVQE